MPGVTLPLAWQQTRISVVRLTLIQCSVTVLPAILVKNSLSFTCKKGRVCVEPNTEG